MTSAYRTPPPASATSILGYLGGTGCALWLLVMALQPDVGFRGPWLWMGFFWAATIGSGLAVLQCLLYFLSRRKQLQQWPLWSLVAASGILGSALLAPLYWLIGEGLMQGLLGLEATLDDEGDTGTTLGFGLPALALEFSELVGPVTAAWLLISLPRLQGLLPPVLVQRQDSDDSAETVDVAEPTSNFNNTRPLWRQALPKELGDDVIAASSELQYLRVWTTRGSALILGALQEVEDTEAMTGMRIHRSWWVHAGHVRTVRRKADGLVCQLSDGREIPVSRRRKADVLARFGDAARYETSSASPAVTEMTRSSEQSSQTDLH
ncbi:LytTR family transcriptional regulator [Gammaproteobacteria bacterium LSUCC0112]|nr:LytTR family transcriptional regulator [Gammaproteobacteria bacterium LSUCC0112]